MMKSRTKDSNKTVGAKSKTVVLSAPRNVLSQKDTNKPSTRQFLTPVTSDDKFFDTETEHDSEDVEDDVEDSEDTEEEVKQGKEEREDGYGDDEEDGNDKDKEHEEEDGNDSK